jgi:multiple sugar transport system permease protein
MKRGEALWGYLFVAPLFLGFLIFLGGPLLASLALTFVKWDILSPPQWVGLANYAELARDPIVGKAFYNTVFLMLGIPAGMLLSLLLALAMNQPIRGIGAFRVIYFLPVISSVAAVALLWRWIYNPQFGLLNYLLALVGIPGPDWLGSPMWAKPALMIMGVWGGLGLNMILYLAALQSVPAQLYEAATLDGAGPWQRFRHVTWPMITPTTFFITITSIIGSFQAFAQIHLLTRGNGPGAVGGGPHWATTTVIYYLWQQAFSYYRMGYAAALAWVLAAVILLITALQFAASRRWVFYNE